MVDAAVGSKGVFGRAIEAGTLGLPLGAAGLKYFNFESNDISRASKENPSNAITGFGGKDRGTPGDLGYGNGPKYDFTVLRALMDFAAMYGSAKTITDLTGAWLVEFRPGRAANAVRALSLYGFSGGDAVSLPPEFQQGRRCGEYTLTDAANRRVQAEPNYLSPTGDTQSGFPIDDDGNAGTSALGLIHTRGRRPGDSNFTTGKSVYLKVISVTATTVVFKAAYDTPSPSQDGSDFPAVSFGSHTFTAVKAEWRTIVDSNSATGAPIGLFGENFEPYELTIGDQAGSLFAADDLFEIPVRITPLTKTVVPENRLSTFHLANALDGASNLVESQTTKLMRPYQEYFTNSRRFPSNIDPTGDLGATVTFKKRLFDQLFRNTQDRTGRIAMLQSYIFGTPLITGKYEGIEILYPQMAVSALKSGDIPNKNTLSETVTLEAEQPDAAPIQPPTATTTFETVKDYAIQINVICASDPTPYIGAAA